MPQPKKKMTSTRSGNRRSQINLEKISLTPCARCKTPIVPHTVCYVCGSYKGTQVVDVDKKERKKAAHEEELNKE